MPSTRAGALDDIDSLARSEMEVLNKAYALLVRVGRCSRLAPPPAQAARSVSSSRFPHPYPSFILPRRPHSQEGFGVKMTTKDLVVEDNRLTAEDLTADDGDK